jgi:aerobic-type carbon monoxide dehydrogenase small subunit (CoxS/CutS family)
VDETRSSLRPDDETLTSISVNGVPYEAPDLGRNLLSYLRYDLGLTGTKYGCGDGVCGACTILVDGQAQRSCQATVGTVIGGSITTIEGLAREGALHPLQEAFVEESAMQCGYCIPGFIMAATGFLGREPRPTGAQIRQALAENMCRCGTYMRIQRAVERAAEKLSEESE